MLKIKISVIILLIFINATVVFSTALANEPSLELSEEVDKAAEAEAKPKSLVEKILKAKKDLKDKYGTTISFLTNVQIQSALHAKTNEGRSRPSWYYNVALDQKLWSGASVDFEFKGGHNKGIDKLLPTFSGFNSNAGQPCYAYITKFYLKQETFEKKLFLAAGRLDLSDWFDVNKAAGSSDKQFLSDSLVNNLIIPFPQKGLGAMAKFKPVDWFYFQAGASDAKSVSTKVGLNNSFQGTFLISEFGISPQIRGFQGNYRFIVNSDREKLECIDGSGQKNGDYAYALSFDQQISKHITLFCRYGFADKEVRNIQYFWSCGGQLSEPISGRKNDLLGVGMAQSILGEDYRQANAKASAETMYEVYYNFSAHPFVKIIPNLQIVTHPDGDKSSSCDVVIGTRLLIVF
ncbi:MAG: carbohydrate porin [Candidatus Omnitrophota bacterium]